MRIQTMKTKSTTALAGAMALALSGLLAGPAQAIEFSSGDGEVTGSWDTTVSYGLSWRADDATAEGGGGCPRGNEPRGGA